MVRMRMFGVISIAAALAVGATATGAEPQRLRVVTINVWSGLDYEGTWKFGEYEEPARREKRFDLLVEQLSRLEPDVVFVQEANRVGPYSRRLARALGMRQVHQVVNAGIKLGPIGLPSNLKEGLAVLARPGLDLRKVDAWKLSGPLGAHGDALTFHLAESVWALVARVSVNGTPLYLVNVHLVASPAREESVLEQFRLQEQERKAPAGDYESALKTLDDKTARRRAELRRLGEFLADLPRDIPVIVAGDFNCAGDSAELGEFLEAAHMTDAFAAVPAAEPSIERPVHTWDPATNANIGFSARTVARDGKPLFGYPLLDALESGTVSRRIDHVLLSRHFQAGDVKACSVVLDGEREGLKASDHYGLLAAVDLAGAARNAPRDTARVVRPERFRWDLLPILMYDSDIGFGYGLKVFFLNPLGRAESFDLTLFNSSKGERWYRFVFSLPDFETRQGRVYPLALDLAVDYDKYVRYNFFGVGGDSRLDELEQYTREPLDISLTLSRGFSRTIVGQLGLRTKTVRNFNFAEGSRLEALPPALNAGRATFTSLFAMLRYDSRDSFIQPSRGLVIQGEGEFAPRLGWGNVSFGRTALWAQYYALLFYPRTVLALRFGGQSLFGRDLPVQVLLPLGGGSTLRGSPQERYLDKSYLLANAELRFPLVWRLGAVVGLDAGKVWPSWSGMDFSSWVANPTVGLRLAMNTFIVRMDIGLGQDAQGKSSGRLYFNFGHVF